MRKTEKLSTRTGLLDIARCAGVAVADQCRESRPSSGVKGVKFALAGPVSRQPM